jgi:S1-C subfamily serine protease
MNIVDILIIILVLSAAIRGYELGFVRQAFSSGGFFAGLYGGVLLQPHIISQDTDSTTQILLTTVITLGCGVVGLVVGEYIGLSLKNKFNFRRVDKADSVFGSVSGAISLLLIVWLSAAIMVSFPSPSLQNAISNSTIIRQLNRTLPSAPKVVATIGDLIDPNGFPQVFIGSQPSPPTNFKQPSLGDMQAAVDKTRTSVVKVQGRGCGGIVQGSGFVVGSGLIATNAHVVAGINRPSVIDSNGSHGSRVIWFDPDLDFAILRTTELAGKPLIFNKNIASRGTPAVVLGYPGGGAFEADPASVLNQFTAVGRNIYNQKTTEREVYEVSAKVVQGNSGGPLVAQDGTVLGMIFAESTSYENIGYALTNPSLVTAIGQAESSNRSVATGSCTE